MALPRIGLINLEPKRQVIQITDPRGKNWHHGQERLHEAFQLFRAQYPDASPFHGIIQRGPETGPVLRCFAKRATRTPQTGSLHTIGCIRHQRKYQAWQRKYVRKSNVQLRATEITTARVIEASDKFNAQCVVM